MTFKYYSSNTYSSNLIWAVLSLSALADFQLPFSHISQLSCLLKPILETINCIELHQIGGKENLKIMIGYRHLLELE